MKYSRNYKSTLNHLLYSEATGVKTFHSFTAPRLCDLIAFLLFSWNSHIFSQIKIIECHYLFINRKRVDLQKYQNSIHWYVHTSVIHFTFGVALLATQRLFLIRVLQIIYFCLLNCCRNLSISTYISTETHVFVFIYYVCTIQIIYYIYQTYIHIHIYIHLCASLFINLSC